MCLVFVCFIHNRGYNKCSFLKGRSTSMLIIKKPQTCVVLFFFLRWGVISHDSLPDENSCLASLKQEHSVILFYLTTGIRLLLQEVSKPALKCGGEQQVHHLLPQMQAPHRLALFWFSSKCSDGRPFSVALNTGKKKPNKTKPILKKKKKMLGVGDQNPLFDCVGRQEQCWKLVTGVHDLTRQILHFWFQIYIIWITDEEFGHQ